MFTILIDVNDFYFIFRLPKRTDPLQTTLNQNTKGLWQHLERRFGSQKGPFQTPLRPVLWMNNQYQHWELNDFIKHKHSLAAGRGELPPTSYYRGIRLFLVMTFRECLHYKRGNNRDLMTWRKTIFSRCGGCLISILLSADTGLSSWLEILNPLGLTSVKEAASLSTHHRLFWVSEHEKRCR